LVSSRTTHIAEGIRASPFELQQFPSVKELDIVTHNNILPKEFEHLRFELQQFPSAKELWYRHGQHILPMEFEHLRFELQQFPSVKGALVSSRTTQIAEGIRASPF
jgi:hypothetical protein